MSDRPFVNFSEIKSKVTIPAVLEKLGLMDQFTTRNGVLSGVCPLASHEHGPRPNKNQFKADDKKEYWLWRCFGCDSGGDVIELVKGIKELDDAHVRFWFADEFSEVLTLKKGKGKAVQTEESTTEASPGPKPLSFYLNVDLNGARDFLRQRGISLATAERYGGGLYSNPGKMFDGYFVVPGYRWPKQQTDEYPIGYVGRRIGECTEENPRYKIGYECSTTLFGLEQALADSTASHPLVVVEGSLTVLWLADRGWTNVVSPLTASLSEEQVAILVATERPIVLAFDGNEAGYNGMRKGVAALSQVAFVRRVILSEDKEPDELSRDELEEFFGFAKP